MKNQTILVIDFGGQYKQLIAKCVREASVYSCIKPASISANQVKDISPIGIILTGGPNSVYENKINFDSAILSLGIPVLGICYGMQQIAHTLGGKVTKALKSEYGATQCDFCQCHIFDGVVGKNQVLMSHTDQVVSLPIGFETIASTENCSIAGFANEKLNIYGVQFHPEVELSTSGMTVINNFLYKVCHAKGDYCIDDYIAEQIEKIREQVGKEKVLLGLSGGVDSSVCAALLAKAIGKQLYCVFIDHGFMRLNEGDQIEEIFSNYAVNFIRINAQQRFLDKIGNVTDPETKRKIVGKEFAMCFQEKAKELGDIKFLAQGTIYPDIIESGGEFNSTIKSHHNVGGLPKELDFVGVVEPLSGLFKNEVRSMGTKLGLPNYLVNRQPFPGPGLSIRVIGQLTKEKLDILRHADFIMREELEQNNIKSSQYFAIMTDTKTVGVMGDDRTYENLICLRAVNTSDFMTCEFTHIPYDILAKISSRIINEVKGVNRIAYDITNKPPATVEWE